MNFYEMLIKEALLQPDCAVKSLVLGWHASGIELQDGRWGLGAVPNPLKEAHIVREQHTRNILGASAHELVRLVVSPFPQEFAAATAAISALLPAPNGGLSLDSIRLMPKGDNVAVLGYHRSIVPYLRDCMWALTIFDDYRNAPDILPSSELENKLASARWAWLTAEAFRDRALLSMRDTLIKMNGVFLQAPGVPWLDAGYRDVGVSYLVMPHIIDGANPHNVLSRIAVGGDPWDDDELVWKVHAVG